jgi:hydroxyethylthiazole kinase-like uncharacterized protein yjeF
MEISMKLPSAREMQNLDRLAIEHYMVPGMVLMENAGLGTVQMAEQLLGSPSGSFAPIFIGPGNNGGDGLVIGRHLHQRGCLPLIFLLAAPEKLQGNPALNFEIVKKLKLPCYSISNSDCGAHISAILEKYSTKGGSCYAVFDAIFGIGLTRDITGRYAETIDFINSAEIRGKVPIIAADIASGIDTDSGAILGTAVRADYTASYCCAKPGHFLRDGQSCTGKLEVIDIGIPPEAIAAASLNTELVNCQTAREMSGPLQRSRNSHKGSNGHLLLICGSPGKTGAALLTARGGLRGGAGLVSMAVPESLNTIYETSLAEAMTIPLTDGGDGLLQGKDWPVIARHLQQMSAVVIGPGLGQNKSTAELVLTVFHKVSLPVIFDADAINILAEKLQDLGTPGGPRIYTPHPGELSRLLATKNKEINSRRMDSAMEGCQLFANKDHPSIMVLKGAGTITVDDRGRRYLNSTGNPGMAAAGMGDVLSGLIGSLICQGLAPLEAAVTGVYLHGAAGDICKRKASSGFFASEVADMLPLARQQLGHIC